MCSVDLGYHTSCDVNVVLIGVVMIVVVFLCALINADH